MARCFDQTLGNFRAHLIERYDVDTFVATWDIIDNKETPLPDSFMDYMNGLNTKGYEIFKYEEHEERLRKQSDNLQHKGTGMFYNHRSIVPMFFMIKNAHGLMDAYSKVNGVSYDVVIRTRIDVQTSSSIDFPEIDKQTLYIPKQNCCGDPESNDQFFFGSKEAMDSVSNIYSDLEAIYAERQHLHPESTIGYQAKRNNLKTETVNITYNLLRPSNRPNTGPSRGWSWPASRGT